MRARIMWIGLLAWTACNGAASVAPDAMPPPGGDAGIDAMTDAGSDAGIDAPPDGDPGVGACTDPGEPSVVSGMTRAIMLEPLIASSGTTTMIAWTVGSFMREHVAWAKLEDGVVVASGELRGLGTTNEAKLRALGSRFVLHGGGVYSNELFVFDGTAWTRVSPSFFPNLATSGSLLLGLQYADFAPLKGVLFDGTTVGSALTLSPNRFRAVAGDGAGGFGVVTLDTQAGLHFLAYDGVAWGAETPIATLAAAPSEVSIVRAGATWAVEYTVSGVPTVAVLEDGSWGETSFPGLSSKSFALAANGSTIALAGDGGFVALRAGGTWTPAQLATAPVSSQPVPPELAAFGPGFAVVYGGDRFGSTTPLAAAIHDGTTWQAPVTLAAAPTPRRRTLAVAGATVAVGFGRDDAIDVPHVAIYRDGAWSEPLAITAGPSKGGAVPAVHIEPGGVRAVYAEPGKMVMRREAAGAWAAAEALPATPTPGSVQGHAIARASDGRALAAWTQEDADDMVLFAAAFDGTAWGAPVRLDTVTRLLSPSVAASGTTFAIAWNDDGVRRAAAWTGAGITAPADLGTFSFGNRADPVRVASDGTRFVAAWSDGASSPDQIASYATSTDGVTWSAPQPFGTQRFELFELAGGPAGIVALANDNSTIHARMFHDGAWSEPATMFSNGRRCDVAIAAATALAACAGTSSIAARQWADGAWSSVAVPPAADQEPEDLALGTDGTAYRLDFHRETTTEIYSSVYADGQWSPLAISPGLDEPHFTAGLCGGWVLVHGDTIAVTATTGADPYPVGRATALTAPPRLVRGPNTIDAAWAASVPATFDSPVLFVALGL